MLHIAPELCLYRIFSSLSNLIYVPADLSSGLSSVALNLEQMPFPENQFDTLFCNHVLEHVKNDGTAMSELCRIIKRGGFAIVLSAVEWERERTYEDPMIVTPEGRAANFGQSDHFRIYGKDYLHKLEAQGFKAELIDFGNTLGWNVRQRYCLGDQRYIVRCSKPDST